MNKRVLVLAGGVPQIKLINELHERDCFVIVADYNENPVAKKYADIFYQKSTLDLNAIREIAIREKVDMILTCCTDQAVHTMAVISKELNLPCYLREETGVLVTNKLYMKRKFRENDIPTADFWIAGKETDLTVDSFPLIVKPVDCNSSKGVVKVRNKNELNIAVNKAIDLSRTKTAIVEEFIEGKELSVDAIVVNGKAKILCVSTSDKIKDDNKFVIYRGYYPANISGILYKRLEEIVQKIATSFKLENSPMLVQVLNKEDRLYVIEFSARTGGCIKYHMIQLASGVDVINVLVDISETKDVNINIRKSDKVIVNEFLYCTNGEFKCLYGFNECVQEGILERVFLLKNEGAVLNGVESSGDRIAAITYVAKDYGDYVKKHNQVAERVKILDSRGIDIMRHDLLGKI